MKSLLRLEMRCRTTATESIANRHYDFMTGLQSIPPPWGLKPGMLPPAPTIMEGQLHADYYLAPHMEAAGIDLKIVYVFRGEDYLRDTAQYDDYIVSPIGFCPAEYRVFVQQVFPEYIRVFKPYRAAIEHDEIAVADWKRVIDRSQGADVDIDGRGDVSRLWPVSYYDRHLCQHAFGLSPEEVVSRVRGTVRSATVVGNGVLVIYTYDMLDGAETERVSAILQGLLS